MKATVEVPVMEAIWASFGFDAKQSVASSGNLEVPRYPCSFRPNPEPFCLENRWCDLSVVAL